MEETHYDVLGVDSAASMEDIRRAYRDLILKWHPDKNPDSDTTELFQRINDAYEILSDESKRAQYDNELAGTLEDNGIVVIQVYRDNDIFMGFPFAMFDNPFERVMRDHQRMLQSMFDIFHPDPFNRRPRRNLRKWRQ